MYQRSRKVLTCLVVVFLAIRVANAVMLTIGTMQISGGDSFTVLMKTHGPYSLGADMYGGFAQIFGLVQLFVLGPRLILGVREYHAELVANSDTATTMTSIAFEERIHASTSSSV
ncbi:hypothetical protein DFJ58DRAFT_843916 [Suillus subalutaceus]|uniref:uncharacterized protein n=1 Tax=Suillus subalutaceus TaxID=48586 RepID=UPI001B85E983|nr:uncharacterized protein DFJ58DRAFT_843916 [Suillus subalutaceus]KAG1844818.1 hypothetical protein DFJ58DRAFT_843916 [Suillus subalutaceus]